jgi:two-component system sensor histidine kinase BaeS
MRAIVRSTAVKLTLAFLLVSVLGTALAALYARQATQSEFDRFVRERAQNDFVSAAAAYYTAHGGWEGANDALRQAGGPPSSGQPGERPGGPIPFALAGQDGRIVVANNAYPLGDPAPAADLQAGLPVTVNGEVVGTVLVPSAAPPLDPREQQYLERTDRALMVAALAATLAALLAGVFLARSLSRPLREVTAAVRQVAQGRLEQQVPVRSRDEVGELAAAFNAMSASLQRSNRLRRQMTADIAHDLRSPLAVMSGYLESLRDGVLPPTPERFATLYTEVQHLQRLVEDLRTLSLADAGDLVVTRQPVSPGELLVRLSAAYQGQAETRGITLAVDIAEGLPAVEADHDRMVQVLGNLVGNALAHTPPGGTITLSARAEDGQVVLAVRDTGAGMTPEVLDHAFERLYRGDSARRDDGSSGLGLAIAKALVELHGGTITAASAGPGQGSEFVVRLASASEDRRPRLS